MFTPQLPMAKQKAIKGIYLGTVNKIIMEFGKPFWKSLGNVFGLMWEQEDLEQLRHSKFAWTEGVSMFLKVDRQPNLLVAWMIGSEGRQAEQLPDKEIIDGMMFLLKKFFKNKGVERPIRMIRYEILTKIRNNTIIFVHSSDQNGPAIRTSGGPTRADR